MMMMMMMKMPPGGPNWVFDAKRKFVHYTSVHIKNFKPFLHYKVSRNSIPMVLHPGKEGKGKGKKRKENKNTPTPTPPVEKHDQ